MNIMSKHKHKWRDVLIDVDEHLSCEKYCKVCGKVKFDAHEFFHRTFTYDEEKQTFRKYENMELRKKYVNLPIISIAGNFDYTQMPDEAMKQLKEKI